MHRFYKAESSKCPSGQKTYTIEKAKNLLLKINENIVERKQSYTNLIYSLESARENLKIKTEDYLKNPEKSLKDEIIHLQKILEHCHNKLRETDVVTKINELEEQYQKIKEYIEGLEEEGPAVPDGP